MFKETDMEIHGGEEGIQNSVYSYLKVNTVMMETNVADPRAFLFGFGGPQSTFFCSLKPRSCNEYVPTIPTL